MLTQERGFMNTSVYKNNVRCYFYHSEGNLIVTVSLIFVFRMNAMNLLLVSTQCIHLHLIVSNECYESLAGIFTFSIFVCLLLHEKALEMFYVPFLVRKLSDY